MNSGVIDIEWWRLAAAYLFIVILVGIVKWRRINREKEIVIATFRMSIQLVLVGFILEYVFNGFGTEVSFLKSSDLDGR
ncbi:ABC transporter permease [Bacillus sp. IITD106]|nr:ABC transporter permease [Bacillus sp. IITD106]